MRRLRLVLAVASCGVALQALPVGAQGLPAARRDSVLAVVRNFTEMSNRADVTGILDHYSRAATVSSAGLGTIRRGFDALRAQADSAAGMEGLMRFSLGAVDVTALGVNHVLVVSAVVVRVETEEGPVQLRGAMSLVLERSGGSWKILHEHFSLPLPEG